MDDKKINKKRLIINLIIVVAFALLVAYLLKMQNTGPSQEEKIQILEALNEDAKNTEPLPPAKKEIIINSMGESRVQLTPEEKAAIIKEK